jgi:hypothetical protein
VSESSPRFAARITSLRTGDRIYLDASGCPTVTPSPHWFRSASAARLAFEAWEENLIRVVGRCAWSLVIEEGRR